MSTDRDRVSKQTSGMKRHHSSKIFTANMTLEVLQYVLVEDFQPEKEAKTSQKTTKQDTDLLEKGDIVFMCKCSSR